MAAWLFACASLGSGAAGASTTINESFGPSVINQGDQSVYTLTITNDSTTVLSGAAVTVFLDNSAGTPNSSGGAVSVASGTVLANTCQFTGITAVAGSNQIMLTGGTVPAGTVGTPSQCVFSLNVRSLVVGTFHSYIPSNTAPSASVAGYRAFENSNPVTNGTSADVTLQVNAIAPPTGSKSYSPTSATAGDKVQLTIRLANPNSTVTMPLTTFTDVLPSHANGHAMRIADSLGSVSCSGTGAVNGVLSAVQGSDTLSLSGATIGQGGVCTLQVNVSVAAVDGLSELFDNSLADGAIGNTRGLVSPAFNKSLSVSSPVGVSKSFSPSTIPAGQPTLLTLVIGNSSNSQALPITAFTDDMSSGSITVLTTASGLAGVSDPSVSCTGSGAANGTLTAVQGASSIGLSDAVAGPGGACTIKVYTTSTVDGQRTNTVAANSVLNPAGFASPAASASFQTNAQLTVSKTVSVASVAPGQWTDFSVTIRNYSGGEVTGVSFRDALPAASGVQMVLQGGGNPTSLTGCTGGSWSGTDALGAGTGAAPADGDAGLSWSGGTIAAGVGAAPGVCTIVFRARLPGTATEGLRFDNQIPIGSISGTGPAGAVGNTNLGAANVTVVSSAAVSKQFSPQAIAQGGLSTLTIKVYNRTLSALSGMNLLDALPSGLTLAANPAPSNNCGGTLVAAPNGTSVSLSGGSLPARPDASQDSSCTITVRVTGAAVGNYTNTIAPGNFSNDQGAGFTTAVTAALAINTGLGGGKSFEPASIASGGRSRVTLTLSNSSNGQLTNVSVNDDGFGAGLVVANPANASSSCAGSPTLVANPGSASVQLNGGTLVSGGSCQFSFDVQATGSGPWSNTIAVGRMSSDQGISNTAVVSATLNQAAAQININKSFNPVIVTGGVPSTLTLTLTNPSALALHGIGFTDVFPAGIEVYSVPSISSTCSGGTVQAIPGDGKVSLSGATMAAGSSCEITLQTTSVKFLNLTNSIPAGAITSSEGYTNPSLVSATLSTLQGLGVMKGFEPSYVTPQSVTTLKMSLVSTFDPNASTPMVLTGLSYTDTLPTGLVVAPNPRLSTTCPGPGGSGQATITAAPGSNLVTVTQAQLDAGSRCSIEVDVVAPASLGTYTNLIPAGALHTDQGPSNNSPASAPLYVVNQPTIAKAFSPQTVDIGEASTLTVTISNGAAIDLTGVALTDVLPAGLSIAASPAASTSCPNGQVTAQPGAASLSLSGARVPAGSACTFQAKVVGQAHGSYNNGIAAGQVSNDQGMSNAGPAAATLTIMSAPTVSKAFAPASVNVNDNSILTLTLGNSNASAITLSADFVDALPTELLVSTPSLLGGSCPGVASVSTDRSAITYPRNASIPAGGCTLTVAVSSSQAGVYTNLIAAGQLATSAGSNPQPATADLSVGGATLPPTLAKAFSPTRIAVNGVSTLTLTLGNANASALTLSAPLVDSLPAGLVLASPVALAGNCALGSVSAVPGSASLGYASGASIPAGGCSISVNVTSSTGGSYTNTLPAGALSTDGGSNGQPAVAGLVVQASVPPTVQKAFSPNTLNPGGTSTLTITLGNASGSAAVLTADLVDTLPAQVQIASVPAIAGSCTSASVTAVAGGSTVRYASGAGIPAGGCTIQVNVTASVPGGPYTNTIATGALQTDLGSNGAPAVANLFVNPAQPPSLSKSFSPVQIGVGSSSTLTLSFGNGNATATTLSADLVDTFPANLLMAAVPNLRVGGGCSLASVVLGSNTLTYKAGGAIPAGGCTVSVDVSSTTVGSYTNTIAAGALQTGSGSNAVATSANLVVSQLPTLAKSFSPVRILAEGGTSTLTLTLGNPNASALTLSAALTDTLPLGLVVADAPNLGGSCPGGKTAVAGSRTVSYASAASLPAGSCTLTVSVRATAAGDYVNTLAAGALQTNGGGNAQPVSATLTALAGPTLSKSFTPASVLPQRPSTLTLSLGNGNASALTLSAALTDTLPDGLVVASPADLGGSCPAAALAPAGGSSVSYPSGASVPAGGCTITLKVVAAKVGTYTNTIAAGSLQTDGGSNPQPASAVLSVVVDPASVPTLAEGALWALTGLLGGIAALGLRRRRPR